VIDLGGWSDPTSTRTGGRAYKSVAYPLLPGNITDISLFLGAKNVCLKEWETLHKEKGIGSLRSIQFYQNILIYIYIYYIYFELFSFSKTNFDLRIRVNPC
jgi:hypothetical protein